MKRIPVFLVILVLFLCGDSSFLYGAVKLRIQGVVTDFATNRILKNVNIASQGTLLAQTDIDGQFVIYASPDAELLFNLPGYNDIVIKTDNRQILHIRMTGRELEIPEVVILGKENHHKISAEPTDLEVKGNYFHLKTRFRIPSRIFKSDKRFIIQPSLYDATSRNYSYFRPVVIDGKHFEINNTRVNEFQSERDSVIRFQVDNELKKNNYIYAYYDSLFVVPETVNHDYTVRCYLAVNGLTPHKRDYLDTVVIAKGTKNPLRFISYGFIPFDINNPDYYPEPEMNLMTENGISRINFRLGDAGINWSEPENAAELDKIKRMISRIIANEDATIRSVSVKGYTSPDGSFERNKNLAHDRALAVLNILTKELPESIRPYIKINSSSAVESWEQVSALVRKDSLPFACKFDSIVRLASNDFAKCQRLLKQMPEYRTIIVPDYLPHLRKTEYQIEYTIFRNLKDEEIAERYAVKQKPLTRYEYWRLSEILAEGRAQQTLVEEAIRDYPDFLLLANKHAVNLIRRDSFSTSVLKPVIQDGAPWEINFNQSVMALGTREYALADSLCRLLPDSDEVSYLKAINAALNGRYEEAYPMVVSKGGLNEILILLCMNRNKDADHKISALLDIPENADNAHYWYIRAICANRNDNLTIAMESLRKALNLNPSLKDIAKLDSDIMDVLDLVDLEK
ncbi:MAG: hypothetical protein ACRCX4_08050 [Bacteroidales bacterium]